jgi:hypothetical protein
MPTWSKGEDTGLRNLGSGFDSLRGHARINGLWRSLGARCFRVAEVVGSNPANPTVLFVVRFARRGQPTVGAGRGFENRWGTPVGVRPSSSPLRTPDAVRRMVDAVRRTGAGVPSAVGVRARCRLTAGRRPPARWLADLGNLWFRRQPSGAGGGRPLGPATGRRPHPTVPTRPRRGPNGPVLTVYPARGSAATGRPQAVGCGSCPFGCPHL